MLEQRPASNDGDVTVQAGNVVWACACMLCVGAMMAVCALCAGSKAQGEDLDQTQADDTKPPQPVQPTQIATVVRRFVSVWILLLMMHTWLLPVCFYDCWIACKFSAAHLQIDFGRQESYLSTEGSIMPEVVHPMPGSSSLLASSTLTGAGCRMDCASAQGNCLKHF